VAGGKREREARIIRTLRQDKGRKKERIGGIASPPRRVEKRPSLTNFLSVTREKKKNRSSPRVPAKRGKKEKGGRELNFKISASEKGKNWLGKHV